MLDTAPESSRDDLKALEARYGTVLNMFGGMAHVPTVIGLFAAAEATIAERTSLDRKARKAIHLTVVQVDGCRYCQAASTGAARMAGFSDDEAIAIRRGVVDFDQLLAALDPGTRTVSRRGGLLTTPVAPDAGVTGARVRGVVAPARGWIRPGEASTVHRSCARRAGTVTMLRRHRRRVRQRRPGAGRAGRRPCGGPGQRGAP